MENTYFIVSIVLTQAATLMLMLGAYKRNYQIQQTAAKLNELVGAYNSTASALLSLIEALTGQQGPGSTSTDSQTGKSNVLELVGTPKPSESSSQSTDEED